MIVIAMAIAVTMWPIASQMPATRIQMTLPMSDADARGRLVDSRLAERPQRVDADPERRDAERDRDDEDAADHTGEEVAEREPQAAEDQPDDVQQNPHGTFRFDSGRDGPTAGRTR